jgi:hypothetical protein
MTAILAQVRGNAVGAGCRGQLRRPYRIRMAAATGVADGCDVVDIDAEAELGVPPSSFCWPARWARAAARCSRRRRRAR